MTTLGIIPARGGSKRLPGKNIRPLGGKPLIAWAIEAGQSASRIDKLIVTSDDPKILDVARGYDPSLVVERPAELAQDDSPAIEYVHHALGLLEDDDTKFDTIVILQGTSPFTLPEDIDATLELLDTSGADSAVSVMKLDHAIHPVKLKTMQGDKLLPYLEEEAGRMAAQDLPELYVRNCSVYATRRHVVDAGQIIGADCRGHLMPTDRSIDINELIDFEFAQFMLQRRNQQ